MNYTINLKNNFFSSYFRINGRKFPWRNINITPFELLITEILLKQTRAESVEKIWQDFVLKYNSPEKIVSTDETHLIGLLAILGFGQQRVDALLKLSSFLIREYKSKVPRKYDKLMKIPFIGPYTANAVLCFAFNKREAIVDVNVLRFYSRFYGITLTNYDIRRNKWIWECAKEHLPQKQPFVLQHNYGILDFCGMVCKSRYPLCKECTLNKKCLFYINSIS